MSSHTIRKKSLLSFFAILIACIDAPLKASEKSKIRNPDSKKWVLEFMDKNPEMSCQNVAASAATRQTVIGLGLTAMASASSWGTVLGVPVVTRMGIVWTYFSAVNTFLHAYETCIAHKNEYRQDTDQLI